MLREEIRRELERELTSEKGCRVWVILQRLEPMLREFPTVFDLINALKNPKAPRDFTHPLILRLIGLYRELRNPKSARQRTGLEQTSGSPQATIRNSQSVILAILLLVLWDNMEQFTEEEHYKLWRIDDEPFVQAQFTYINLIAEGNFNHRLHRLVKGEHIKSILYDEAKEIIKEEYKKQCVYEI